MPEGEENEQRREERTPSVHPLRFHAVEGPCGARRCFGLTRNISKSGFCMYSGYEFEPGAVLEVIVESSRPRRAMVRWCTKRVQSHLYMVGLSFLTPLRPDVSF